MQIKHLSNAFILSITVLGVILRLIHYFSNRSLWLDESLLAHNICSRNFNELMYPLDNNQGAPILYLWITKFCTQIGGCNEYALRFPSLFAGILVMPLTYAVARCHLKNRTAAGYALAIISISPSMVYYSSEVKQYSIDAFASLTILYLMSWFAAKPQSILRGCAFAMSGVCLMEISHPSVFVLFTAGCWLLTVVPWKSDRRCLALALLISVTWASSFVVNYIIFLLPIAKNNFFIEYWSYSFIKFPPMNISDFRQYISVFIGVFEFMFESIAPPDTTGQRVSMLGVCLWIAGFVALCRNDWRSAGLFSLSFAVVLLMASLDKYPARGRLILFALPMFAITISYTLTNFFDFTKFNDRLLAICLFGGLLILPTLYGLYSIVKPPSREEVRPILEIVANRALPDDNLFIYYETDYIFQYYQDFSSIRGLNLDTIVFNPDKDSTDEFNTIIDQARGRRMWLIFSHLHGEGEYNDGAKLITLFNERGTLVEKYHRQGASAFLYYLPPKP